MKQSQILFLLAKIYLFYFSPVAGNIKIKKVTDYAVHGEGPYWDSDKQVLYFVDISKQSVNKYDPRTGNVNQVYLGAPVSLVTRVEFEDDKFVVGRGLDIVSMTWDGESSEPSDVKVLASVDKDKPKNRFNDGRVDASGRLWAGTMGPEDPELRPLQGALYSFDWSDRFKPIKHVSPVSVSNGISWNENDTLMYFIDSPTRVVSVFDFDIVSGKIRNKRELFSLEKNNITGFPDGMTIDSDDNLWVAVFQGNCILHIDTAEGKLLKKINLPVSQVTSCAFGGEDLTDLYVTTSRVQLSDDDLEREPLAGSLFKITGTGARGQTKPQKIRLV